ncbi:NlpC/P60 family protein [Nonomuraea cavernae]|uniref:NlpC/P60 family protein n=1 Tax=Nonomuraea cavernae TaxID=2045107 RepID=UPI0016671C65|nr:NlpC/P60 family protein [Nonomuraea cavernae]MCA2187738.1 NlpC/P60 family protein [Nonomuraea cavernae]
MPAAFGVGQETGREVQRGILSSLKKISVPVEADTSAARSSIEALRREAERAAGQSVRVRADADTGAAQAALAALGAVVSGLDGRRANVNADADVGGAVANLAVADAAVSRLDGRTAHVNVNVDAGMALAKLAAVSSGLLALSATAAAVAGGVVAVLTPALLGVAGIAAVAIPALGRINESLNAQEQAGNAAARGLAAATGATRNLVIEQAQAQIKVLQAANAAETLRSAQDRVKDAVGGVVEAQNRLKQAVQSAASAQAAAAQRAAAAERSLADAQRQALKAQEDLNRARQQAIKDLEGVARSLRGNALDQREAALDVADAERELAAARKGGNAEDIERASISYERAKIRVEELRAEQERLNAEQAKGVEGNDRVVSAKQAVESANARVIDQERALAQAYAESGKAGEEAAQRVADARKALADAEKRVDDAKRAVEGVKRQQKIAALQEKIAREQAKQQAKQAALAARQSATATPKGPDLSPAEKAAAKSLQAFKKTYEKFQKDLGGAVLPVITGGLKVVEKLFKPMTPLIKASAGALVTLEKSAAKALGGKFWTDFFKQMTAAAPGAIGGLGKIIGDLIVGFAGLVKAALPLMPVILRVFGTITGAFASLAKGLSGDAGFKAVIDIIKTAFEILVAYWQNVLGPVIVWLWQNIVTPALQGIAWVVKWAWENVIQPAVSQLVVFWQTVLGPAITWLWENVIKPAWDAISKAISYAWTNWIQPALKALWTFITQTLGPKVLWFHDTIVKPVFQKIGEFIKYAWTNWIQPALKAVWTFITETLAPKVVWFHDTIVKPVFTKVGEAIAFVWEKVVKPAFSALWTFISETLPNGFKKGVELVGKFWDGLKAVAKAPVNFVIETVYNNGIVKLWNTVADALGLKDMKLAPLPALATGGVLPGYTPGRDTMVAAVSGGEAVMRPEWTRAVGSDFVHQANAAARHGGVSGASGFMRERFAGGFATGGIIGDVLAKGVKVGAEAFLNPILDQAAKAMGGSQWGQMLTAWPKKMVADVVKFLEGKEAAQGGAGAGKALAFARAQLGKPYQWGGTGPGSFDCSGLTMRAWQAAGRGDIPRTSQQQMGWVKQIAKPVPGALGFPHPGHVWLYASPNTIVEAPQTGLKVREVAARAAQLVGVPPATYDSGGFLPTGHSLVYNGTGSPEPVLTDQQWKSLAGGAQGGDGPMVNIQGDYITNDMQTPDQMARDLYWLSKSRPR